MSVTFTTTQTGFGTFFLPGPTEVRPEILAAMQRQMIPHRGRAFEALFAGVEAGLRDVFLTGRPVYVSTSSASGLMEAAIRNAPPGPILSLVNGAFSERFAKIAKACAREVDTIAVAWGETFDLGAVRERLANPRTAQPYVAVTVAQSETSTGVLTDVHAVSNLAHEHGAMALVDSVSGLGGAELTADAWGLDFVLTGSQKALALPPGLAFAVASPQFVERARSVPDRGLYFDVVEMEEYAQKNQTPSTPAVSLIYALEAQLGDIGREGIERRWARHRAMQQATAEWVESCAERLGTEGKGLRVLAPEGSRSPTVSTIVLPPTISSGAVVGAVGLRGYVIGSGYGKLRDTTIRIGHMGDHTVDGLLGCLTACEDALSTLLGD